MSKSGFMGWFTDNQKFRGVLRIVLLCSFMLESAVALYCKNFPEIIVITVVYMVGFLFLAVVNKLEDIDFSFGKVNVEANINQK